MTEHNARVDCPRGLEDMLVRSVDARTRQYFCDCHREAMFIAERMPLRAEYQERIGNKRIRWVEKDDR